MLFQRIQKSLLGGVEELKIRAQVETVETQNTEMSPGDLRRLAVTQTLSEKLSANAGVKNS